MIFILNGVNESGKNTFVDFINELTDKPTYHISTIDWVKKFCQIEYGMNPNEKTDVNRGIWHQEKMLHKNYIRYLIEKKIDSLSDLKYDNIIFIDCREPEEIEYLKDKLNAKTILIKKDKVVASNNADQNVNNYKYDIIIENNGDINELKLKAKQFIKEYL